MPKLQHDLVFEFGSADDVGTFSRDLAEQARSSPAVAQVLARSTNFGAEQYFLFEFDSSAELHGNVCALLDAAELVVAPRSMFLVEAQPA